jgi:hypothetical protein
MRFYYYVLEGKTPVPLDRTQANLLIWGEWFEHADRRVAQTQVGPYWVSTVFLGLDHNFTGTGPPILFETMVFSSDEEGERGSPVDLEMHRYSTWEVAEMGHHTIVQLVKLTLEQQADVKTRQNADHE